MTHVPMHAPRAAPGAVALRCTGRRHVGLALGVAWLVLGAAVGVTVAGANRPPSTLGQIEPAAVVAAPDPVLALDSLDPPHDPMSWRSWPGTTTSTVQMQPIPSFVGVDDPPVLGPAPAVDPAVERLLAQLRDEAKGSPEEARPGPKALVALGFALAQVGRPYVWGAIGPESYDCSGLTWQSYAHAGVELPRVSADQYATGGPHVAIADLRPGDLVFFATAAWDPGAVHHVGMYVGRGLMVDSPHPGGYVRVEPVTAAGYVGAVRVVPALPGAPTATAPPSPSATPTEPGPASPPVSPPTDPTMPLPMPLPMPPPSDPTTPTPSDPPPDPSTPAPSGGISTSPEPSSDPSPPPTTEPAPDPGTDPTGEPPA